MIRQLLVVFGAAIVLSCPLATQAQFTDAIIPSYGYGLSPVTSAHTDNDIQDIAGVTYEVAVSDDQANNQIFGWQVGSNTGFLNLGPASLITRPAIALVKNNGNTVYAVVVYYNPMVNEIRRQTFVWNSPQQQFNYWSELLLSPGDVYSTLRISSDDNGFFAIVWDEPGQQVKLMTGQALSAAPVMMNGGQVFNLPELGEQPDVAVFRRAQDGYRRVLVSYINQATSISVDAFEYTELSSGVLNPTLIYRTPVPDLMYRNPRIACPGSLYWSASDFALVTEDTDDNSTWYIKGFINSDNPFGILYLYIYNDGSTSNSPYDITSVPNTRPVVSYDRTADNIWVAWNVDNSWGLLSAPGAYMAEYPITVCGDKLGEIYPAANYLYVPSNVTWFSKFGNVSVAGNKSTKLLFTYSDNLIMEMLSKSMTQTSNPVSLRSSLLSWNGWLDELAQQATTDFTLNVEIFDITGKMIYDKCILHSSAHELMDRLLTELSQGTYILHASVTNQANRFKGKLVKIDSARE